MDLSADNWSFRHKGISLRRMDASLNPMEKHSIETNFHLWKGEDSNLLLPMTYRYVLSVPLIQGIQEGLALTPSWLFVP